MTKVPLKEEKKRIEIRKNCSSLIIDSVDRRSAESERARVREEETTRLSGGEEVEAEVEDGKSLTHTFFFFALLSASTAKEK